MTSGYNASPIFPQWDFQERVIKKNPVSKQDLLKFHIGYKYTRESSKKLTRLIKRVITESPPLVIDTRYRDYILGRIIYVHDFNLEVAKNTSKYPWSRALKDLLKKYIETCFKIFENQKNYDEKELDKTKSELVQLLLNIYNKHRGLNSSNKENVYLGILKLLLQLPVECIRSSRPPLVQDMITAMLEKLELMSDLNGLVNKILLHPLDSETSSKKYTTLYDKFSVMSDEEDDIDDDYTVSCKDINVDKDQDDNDGDTVSSMDTNVDKDEDNELKLAQKQTIYTVDLCDEKGSGYWAPIKREKLAEISKEAFPASTIIVSDSEDECELVVAVEPEKPPEIIQVEEAPMEEVVVDQSAPIVENEIEKTTVDEVKEVEMVSVEVPMEIVDDNQNIWDSSQSIIEETEGVGVVDDVSMEKTVEHPAEVPVLEQIPELVVTTEKEIKISKNEEPLNPLLGDDIVDFVQQEVISHELREDNESGDVKPNDFTLFEFETELSKKTYGEIPTNDSSKDSSDSNMETNLVIDEQFSTDTVDEKLTFVSNTQQTKPKRVRTKAEKKCVDNSTDDSEIVDAAAKSWRRTRMKKDEGKKAYRLLSSNSSQDDDEVPLQLVQERIKNQSIEETTKKFKNKKNKKTVKDSKTRKPMSEVEPEAKYPKGSKRNAKRPSSVEPMKLKTPSEELLRTTEKLKRNVEASRKKSVKDAKRKRSESPLKDEKQSKTAGMFLADIDEDLKIITGRKSKKDAAKRKQTATPIDEKPKEISPQPEVVVGNHEISSTHEVDLILNKYLLKYQKSSSPKYVSSLKLDVTQATPTTKEEISPGEKKVAKEDLSEEPMNKRKRKQPKSSCATAKEHSSESALLRPVVVPKKEDDQSSSTESDKGGVTKKIIRKIKKSNVEKREIRQQPKIEDIVNKLSEKKKVPLDNKKPRNVLEFIDSATDLLYKDERKKPPLESFQLDLDQNNKKDAVGDDGNEQKKPSSVSKEKIEETVKPQKHGKNKIIPLEDEENEQRRPVESSKLQSEDSFKNKKETSNEIGKGKNRTKNNKTVMDEDNVQDKPNASLTDVVQAKEDLKNNEKIDDELEKSKNDRKKKIAVVDEENKELKKGQKKPRRSSLESVCSELEDVLKYNVKNKKDEGNTQKNPNNLQIQSCESVKTENESWRYYKKKTSNDAKVQGKNKADEQKPQKTETIPSQLETPAVERLVKKTETEKSKNRTINESTAKVNVQKKSNDASMKMDSKKTEVKCLKGKTNDETIKSKYCIKNEVSNKENGLEEKKESSKIKKEATSSSSCAKVVEPAAIKEETTAKKAKTVKKVDKKPKELQSENVDLKVNKQKEHSEGKMKKTKEVGYQSGNMQVPAKKMELPGLDGKTIEKLPNNKSTENIFKKESSLCSEEPLNGSVVKERKTVDWPYAKLENSIKKEKELPPPPRTSGKSLPCLITNDEETPKKPQSINKQRRTSPYKTDKPASKVATATPSNPKQSTTPNSFRSKSLDDIINKEPKNQDQIQAIVQDLESLPLPENIPNLVGECDDSEALRMCTPGKPAKTTKQPRKTFDSVTANSLRAKSDKDPMDKLTQEFQRDHTTTSLGPPFLLNLGPFPSSVSGDHNYQAGSGVGDPLFGAQAEAAEEGEPANGDNNKPNNCLEDASSNVETFLDMSDCYNIAQPDDFELPMTSHNEFTTNQLPKLPENFLEIVPTQEQPLLQQKVVVEKLEVFYGLDDEVRLKPMQDLMDPTAHSSRDHSINSILKNKEEAPMDALFDQLKNSVNKDNLQPKKNNGHRNRVYNSDSDDEPEGLYLSYIGEDVKNDKTKCSRTELPQIPSTSTADPQSRPTRSSSNKQQRLLNEMSTVKNEKLPSRNDHNKKPPTFADQPWYDNVSRMCGLKSDPKLFSKEPR